MLGTRPMAAMTWSTTTRLGPLLTSMPPGTSRSSAGAPVCSSISCLSTAASSALRVGSFRPAKVLPVVKAATSMPRRASACAISTPITPMPITATRGPSVGCSNRVSVVRMRSPKASQASGTRGREPVAMMMLRVA